MATLAERLGAELSDRYRIEREIGQGGMAVVFLAHDLKHGREVALKVLRPELAHELGVDRFLREIGIAARLSHPHILPLFDSGEAGGLLYFVMPFVEGESLRERLERQGPLPVEEAVRLALEVGDALTQAHRAGVLHRDIKPGNILLESGRARVADFGVARALDAAAGDRLTRSGVAVGTPAYMSPEQATGASELDERSDVYSLACVVYEMLAGSPPFVGSARAVVGAHVGLPVPPLTKRRAEVPLSIARVVERALAKDPADRYEGAAAFTKALEAANTAVARARAVRARRLRRGAALATAIALAFAGWKMIAARAAPAVQRIAVLPATSLTGDPDQDYFVTGVHQALVGELQRAGIATIARQSVLRYRDSDLSVREIARELGVDALVEPMVGLTGDSVSIEVSLVDAGTQLPIWSGRFDRPLSGVLGLYRELSGAIATEIGTAMGEEARARLAERPVIDPRAYQDYLLGLHHLGMFTPSDFGRARAYFEAALERAPDYAEAYLGLYSVWGFQAQAGFVAPTEAQLRQRELLGRALALDPRLPEARRIEAARKAWQEWKPAEAEPLFRLAVELDPGDGRTRAFHGHVLTILGRWEEADRAMRAALDVDPLDPFLRGLFGAQRVMYGDYEEALAVLGSLFEDTPSAGFGDVFYAEALHVASRHDEEFAIELQNFSSRRESDVAVAFEAGWREGGHEEAARRAALALVELRGVRHVGGLTIAGRLIEAGDLEDAMDWLEVDVRERGQSVPYYGVLPVLRPLHGHDRFRSLMAGLGLPIQQAPGFGAG